jgi:molybdopterin/thiamine biosynthesis adenylyltransferase
MGELFFARAGRAGPRDIAERMPELSPLRRHTISVFGLGALGAVSAMEFARAEVGELRLLDRDHVDPGTVGRWVFGLQVAGLFKAPVIADAIRRDYPFTKAKPYVHCLGAVRDIDDAQHMLGEQSIMNEMTEGTSLIYDATAEIGVQQFLSDYASQRTIPYVSVDASPGAWGGRIVAIVPDTTQGCWMCYQHALDDGSIIDAPKDCSDDVQPAGCAEPTFTGAGFDLSQIALTGVRTVAAILCGGIEGAYPALRWDIITIAFRDSHGHAIVPQFHSYNLKRHPQCPCCNRP